MHSHFQNLTPGGICLHLHMDFFSQSTPEIFLDGHRSIILTHSQHESHFWQHLKFSLLICKVKCLHTDSYTNVQSVLTRLLCGQHVRTAKQQLLRKSKG